LIRFSTREWFGILVAAGWGLLLGLVPFHWGGVWPVVLFGPPVAYLLLPKWPFLSWQISMIAAAVASAYREIDPQDPNDSIWPIALLGWLGYSLFSAPWPYVFQRRAQRAREEGDSSASVTVRYVGAGLVVFLSCGLIIIGAALFYFATANSSEAAHASALDRATPFIGW
jgi:Na+/proline symporter